MSESRTPTVTAVIVNYNYERFVAEAIQSVLDQTDPFDAVFVVDDGSTDDSMRVIRSFGAAVNVIEKVNGGPLSAVWETLPHIVTDYVYVLDADDAAAPDLVDTVRPQLCSNPVKVQFQLQSIDSDSVLIDSIFPSYSDGYSSADMIADNEHLGFYVCASTSGNLFSVAYLRQMSLMQIDGRQAFDGILAQAAPYFGEVVSLNKPLALYRVHDNSLSQWSKPTVPLMEKECNRFWTRWHEVERILASHDIVAASPSGSAYISERELMTSVLEARRPSARVAVRYSDQILRSGLPLMQRFAFVAWALALPIVPLQTSQRLVVSRRSSRKRGPVVTWIAHRARAGRSEAPSARAKVLVPVGVSLAAVARGLLARSWLKRHR